MSVTLRLDEDRRDNSGTITIKAAAGHLAEVVALTSELELRMNVERVGGQVILAEVEPTEV
jgi:hypothetical protein